MSPEPAPRVVIVGVGNPDRGDDAVGLVAARRLRDRVPPLVKVIECNGNPLALVDRWRDVSLAIVVDAMSAGMVGGTVRRFELSGGPIPTSFRTLSTHGMGLREAIRLAREVGCLPRRLVVYGVEGKGLRPGEGLSPEVERALGALQERVLKEARCTKPG